MRFALRWLIVIAITMGGLELGFRLAPGLIPEDLLQRFDRGLRIEIASRRYLPNESQTWNLERDDGGPPLKLFQAFSRIKFHFEDTGQDGVMVMDAQGFCNAPSDAYAREKIDLIALGDSFTMCFPPDPTLTWPSVLGHLLGRPIYSLARGGYGPYEYVQILKRFGLAKKPYVVVMQLYEGNDLRDAARYHEYADALPEEKARFPERVGWQLVGVNYFPFLENWVGRHSYAYNTLVTAIALGVSAAKQLLSEGSPQRVNFRYSLKFPDGAVAMNVGNHDKDEVRTARDLRAGVIRLDAFDGALATFAALARSHGFRPVVSYVPSAYTAYAEFVAFEDPELQDLMSWFHAAQRDYLMSKARELGFEFLDLTPAMQARARESLGKELLYYPINVHCTPAGHRLTAETVAALLRQEMSALGGASAPAATGGSQP
jgi:hypothetical protein